MTSKTGYGIEAFDDYDNIYNTCGYPHTHTGATGAENSCSTESDKCLESSFSPTNGEFANVISSASVYTRKKTCRVHNKKFPQILCEILEQYEVSDVI